MKKTLLRHSIAGHGLLVFCLCFLSCVPGPNSSSRQSKRIEQSTSGDNTQDDPGIQNKKQKKKQDNLKKTHETDKERSLFERVKDHVYFGSSTNPMKNHASVFDDGYKEYSDAMKLYEQNSKERKVLASEIYWLEGKSGRIATEVSIETIEEMELKTGLPLTGVKEKNGHLDAMTPNERRAEIAAKLEKAKEQGKINGYQLNIW